MIYAGLGTIVVEVPGLTIGVHKLIKDTHSHGAYVSLSSLPLLSRRSDLLFSSVKQLEGILQVVTSSSAV
jgi:hypothetical protein